MNILGALAGGVMNLATSAFNHRMSEKSAQEQYNRQLDFWQLQNEYNSPAAQRARLEQAGLNPVSAAEGIAKNNIAGGLSTVPRNEVGASGVLDPQALQNSLTAFATLEQMGANTDFLREQIALAVKESLIKDSEKYGIDLDNDQKKKLLYWLDEEKQSQILKTWKELDLLDYQTDNLSASTDKTVAETDKIRSEISKLDADAVLSSALAETENALRDVKVAVARSQATLNNAQAKKTLSEASKIALEGKIISNQAQRDQIRTSATLFYGFDPTELPDELAATLMNNFAAVVESGFDNSVAAEAMDKCHALLQYYRDKSLWTPTSASYSWSSGNKLLNYSSSWSHSE